jgi:hypothetical protein
MNLDDLLEKSIYRIALRLSSVEDEFFSLAGETLKKIYGMSDEQIKNYLYSADYFEDISDDINKVKKALNAAHNANIKDLAALYDDITATVYDEGADLAKEKGERLPPFTEFRKPFNPMLKDVVSGYKSMAKSAAVSQTYKKTISGMVNRLVGDEGHINYPQAMRKAIRELTEQGITTVDYESGRKVRMDSAVRNALMTEYTEIIEGVQHKLAEEIGADGWEISAHEHPAKDHEDIQGHIFANEEYEKLQNHEDAVDIEGEKFQIGRAIGDWNCRHISYPFLIGISKPSFTKEELAEIQARNEAGVEFHGKRYTLYEAEQLQRRYETEMRKEREQGNLYKQVMEADDVFRHDYTKSRGRLAGLREGYKELGETLKPHAIRTKMERSYVPKTEGGIPDILPNTNIAKKDLFTSAYMTGKGGTSRAGRSFQSHAFGSNRSGIYYGEKTGDAKQNTLQAARFLNTILNGKSADIRMYNHPAYGDIIEIQLPNRLGARWKNNGNFFIGFIE